MFRQKICLLTLASASIFLKDQTADGCFFRSSSWNLFSGSGESASSHHNDLQLDKETLSVVQQTLVKTLISLGKLKFHCPRGNGSHPDMLDCRKYYNCSSSGDDFTTGQCDPGQAYEPSANACVPDANVPLCQKVQKLADYQCNNETGLHTYDGSCNKFILCTEEAAFASSCDHGDVFDQKLMLCLPEKESSCNNIKSISEELAANGTANGTATVV